MPSTSKRRVPRAAERHRTHALAALGGSLVDLSATGMRVRTHARPDVKPGSSYRVEIKSTSQCLRLTARVVWVKRTSLLARTHEFGVVFTNLKPGVGAILEHWAVYGFIPSRDSRAATINVNTGASTATAFVPPTANAATDDLPCFYTVLGVTPDACQAEIHAAYRRLAKTMHPDVCRDEDAPERFAFIARVYQVLGEPTSRKRYDLAIARRAASAAA
ncbi:MAG: DnaJ domain-containing protein [Phycisphaerales bacterium]